MIPLQFSQMNWNGKVIILNAASKMEPMSMMPVCTTFLMVSHVEDRKVVIPVQIFVKKVFTFVHSSVQLVPNQPRNTSAMPFSIPTAADRIPVIPVQIPEKMPLMPSHICVQFPVNKPMNTSRIPTMTSSTVPNTVEITLNAASNTGAST